jgi:hypothetical protein
VFKAIATWFRSNPVRLYGALACVVALTLLAGGLTFAAGAGHEGSTKQSAAARISEARVVTSVLGAVLTAPSEPPPSAAPAAEPAPAAAGPRFEVSCKDAGSIPAQSGDVFDCKVTSRAGFSAPVALKCANLPKGLDCETNPASVTPPADGSVEFHLSLSNQSVGSGKHSFKVTGASGSLTHSFSFPFNFPAGAQGAGNNSSLTVTPTCPMLANSKVARGQTLTTSCQVAGIPGFTGTMDVQCYSAPVGTCTVNPKSVNLSQGVPVPVQLTVTIFHDAPLGGAIAGIGVTDPLGRFTTGGGSFPISVVVSRDYSVSCPPEVSVPVGGTAQLRCEVRTGSYSGDLEIVFGAMAEAGSPAVTGSPTSFRMGPNAQNSVNLTFNAAGVAPGTYQFFVFLRQPGVLFDGEIMSVMHYPSVQVAERQLP